MNLSDFAQSNQSDGAALEQLFVLVEVAIEGVEGFLNRSRSREIDASFPQQIDAVVRAAAGQELDVALHSRFAFFDDLASQRHRGTDAGGILVDVEAVEEVRDARPFDADGVIDLDGGSIVLLVQPLVDGAENIRGESFAGFRLGVSNHLELSEESLPNQGGTDGLELMVEDVLAQFRVVRLGEQLMRQERFVAGRGNLSQEQRVTAVRIGLILAGEPGVHGVTGFVGQGEHGVHGVMPVHEHVRRGAVGAPAVGAGLLALALHDVDPTGVEAATQGIHVLGAQSTHRRQDLFLGFRVGDLVLEVGDHGHVEVVPLELVDTEDAAAQVHVALNARQVGVHRIDQGVIDIHRQVDAFQGVVQGAVILPRLGGEDVQLHVGGVGGSQRVAPGVESAEHGVVGTAASLAVRVVQPLGTPVAVGQRRHLPGFIFHFREAQVGVVEHGVDVARSGEDLGSIGEHRFNFRRANMFAFAGQLVELVLVDSETVVLLDPAFQAVGLDRENLRAHVSHGGADLAVEILDASEQLLVVADGGVDVRVHAGINVELADLLADLVAQGESFEKQATGAAQAAIVGGDLRQKRFDVLEGSFPIGFGSENLGEVPGHFLGNITPFQNRKGFSCHSFFTFLRRRIRLDENSLGDFVGAAVGLADVLKLSRVTKVASFARANSGCTFLAYRL